MKEQYTILQANSPQDLQKQAEPLIQQGYVPIGSIQVNVSTWTNERKGYDEKEADPQFMNISTEYLYTQPFFKRAPYSINT